MYFVIYQSRARMYLIFTVVCLHYNCLCLSFSIYIFCILFQSSHKFLNYIVVMVIQTNCYFHTVHASQLTGAMLHQFD